MNMNYSEQASAMNKMFRERLESVVTDSGASLNSPLAAEWILDSLDHVPSTASTKMLQEAWKLTYMLQRLSTYTFTDKKSDLPHMLTFANRAHVLNVCYHARKFAVEEFERIMANTAKEQLKQRA